MPVRIFVAAAAARFHAATFPDSTVGAVHHAHDEQLAALRHQDRDWRAGASPGEKGFNALKLSLSQNRSDIGRSSRRV